MKIPVIAFFNNKGGVGKTTIVYHLAWMFADQNLKVIAADLDPQSNLTAAFLDSIREPVQSYRSVCIFVCSVHEGIAHNLLERGEWIVRMLRFNRRVSEVR